MKDNKKDNKQGFKMLSGKEIIDNLRGKDKKTTKKEEKNKGIGGR